MSQDPVFIYKDAKEKLDEAYTKVVKLRRIITDTSQMMTHPYEFLISGTDVAFPSEIGLVRTPTLLASDWPTAKQIAQSLVVLHEKYRIAQTAWMNLSQTDRNNVEKLPERD
jgi:hypothetical protein